MVFQRKYKYGTRSFNVPAPVVGEMFEDLEREYGAVTDRNFLDASRPEESPTHKLFEWDDEKAAESYRLHQSRCVINAVKVEVIVEENEPPKTVSAVVNISEGVNDGTAKYVNVVAALSDENNRQIVLNRALRELNAFRHKYETLEELADVINAIGKVLGDETD